MRSIDAPPATAVLAACLGAFGDVPDVVVAGINPGANTGHLVIHSGTVGAALTAAGLDVPAIAVSTRWSTTNEYHWETAAAFAVAAVDWVVQPDAAPRVVNINVPNLPLAEILGVEETELAPHGEVWVASADASSGDLKLDVKGRADAAPGTDVAAVASGLRLGHATAQRLASRVDRRRRRRVRRAGLTARRAREHESTIAATRARGSR